MNNKEDVIGNNSIRENVAEKYNVQWATLIHPAAVLGINVQIGEGTVVIDKICNSMYMMKLFRIMLFFMD